MGDKVSSSVQQGERTFRRRVSLLIKLDRRGKPVQKWLSIYSSRVIANGAPDAAFSSSFLSGIYNIYVYIYCIYRCRRDVISISLVVRVALPRAIERRSSVTRGRSTNANCTEWIGSVVLWEWPYRSRVTMFLVFISDPSGIYSAADRDTRSTTIKSITASFSIVPLDFLFLPDEDPGDGTRLAISISFASWTCTRYPLTMVYNRYITSPSMTVDIVVNGPQKSHQTVINSTDTNGGGTREVDR